MARERRLTKLRTYAGSGASSEMRLPSFCSEDWSNRRLVPHHSFNYDYRFKLLNLGLCFLVTQFFAEEAGTQLFGDATPLSFEIRSLRSASFPCPGYPEDAPEPLCENLELRLFIHGPAKNRTL